jgi:hypothetical protein
MNNILKKECKLNIMGSRLYWTGYAFSFYFTLFKRKFCFRFIPKFNEFSKDRRRIALWRRY